VLFLVALVVAAVVLAAVAVVAVVHLLPVLVPLCSAVVLAVQADHQALLVLR
jgi:hypothetical protein